ncbi:glycosyltransferase family 2 protein [Sulfurimonas sp.]
MQKNNSCIDICMTTYNGEKYLIEQLNSILEQTYQNFRLLICDDKSTDRTLEILKDYKSKFPNKIFYEVNEVNIGFVENFEKLLKKSTANYIALSDQDDIWHKEKLEIQMNILQENENKDDPILVHSDLEMISGNNELLHTSFFKYRKIFLPDSNNLSRLISHGGVMGNTILMNRTVVNLALPFPKKLKYHDYWLPIIAQLYGKRLTIEKSLILYRIHESNTSNSRKSLASKNSTKLPFCNQDKEYVLTYLLNNYKFDENSRYVIKAFIMYLENSTYWFYQIYYIIRYNLVRKNIFYRLRLFSKIMIRSLFKGNK